MDQFVVHVTATKGTVCCVCVTPKLTLSQNFGLASFGAKTHALYF